MFSHKPNESQNETAGITWGFNHRKSEGSGGYEINIIVRLSVNIIGGCPTYVATATFGVLRDNRYGAARII
jgi:hypothetical protein